MLADSPGESRGLYSIEGNIGVEVAARLTEGGEVKIGKNGEATTPVQIEAEDDFYLK